MNWRSRWFWLIIGLIGLWLVFKLYNTSYFSVLIEPQTSGNYTFSAYDQAGRLRKTVKTSVGYVHMRLPRASYQITAQRGKDNYFSVAQGRPFLGTTSITAKLKSEADRSFVGNNPLPCMSYLTKVLVSYSCGSLANELKLHVPATDHQPPYTLNKTLVANGYVQGFVNTPDGTIALANTSDEKAEGQATNHYFLLKLDSNLRISAKVNLSQLDSSKVYTIQRYGGGFIIYDPQFSSILVFADWLAKPDTLTVGKANGRNLKPLSLTTYSGSLSQLYVEQGGKGRSEVVYWDGQTTHNWSLPETYKQALLCETKIVCGLTSDNHLDVYDVSQAKPRRLYRLGGIQAIAVSTNGFVMVAKNGLVNFKPSERSGWLEYSFGGYGFNSLQMADSGYLLNLRSPDNQPVIYINESKSAKDEIDKQALALRQSAPISNLTIYANHLFITANAGQLTYQSSLNGYGVDPAKRQAAIKQIQSAIDRLGIDRQRYSIQIY